MQTRTIQEYLQGLCEISEGDFSLERISEYNRVHPVDSESLAPYLRYQPTHYTRNLIYRCALFELIAICWEVGQVSQIHNHQDQNCWMTVPVGRLAVQEYETLSIDENESSCRLQKAGYHVMTPESPLSVNPKRPIHEVLNLDEFGQRATSLHVYSRPYDHCLVYSLEQNRYRQIPLFYDSQYGKPDAPVASAPLPTQGNSA